jgi:peroxiredoxin
VCGLEFPDLETAFWQEYRDRDLVVIGVDAGGLYGGDTPKLLAEFVEQTGVTFPIGWDDNDSYNQLRPSGGVSPFPVDVIIDKEGRIQYLEPQFDAEAMRAVVERLL